MTRTLNDAARRIEGDYTEGGLARPLDKAVGQLPSDTFLWLAWGSIAASFTLKMMGRDKDALFVGQWAPTFLIHGLYVKMVKQLGHDRYDH
jgi:hypothetical protein